MQKTTPNGLLTAIATLSLMAMLCACGASTSGPRCAEGEHLEAGQCVADDTPEMQREACRLGDMAACTRLGIRYARGDGVKTDMVRAQTLFEKACEAKVGRACHGLGLIYQKGLGVTADQKRAIAYYTLGCELDAPRACQSLGVVYLQGMGVAQDTQRGLTLIENACRLDDSNACYNLGVVYMEGLGDLEVDMARAQTHFEQSCALDDPEGCAGLGAVLMGQDGKASKAQNLLEQACSAGTWMGCYNLALFWQARIDSVPDAAAHAYRAAERGCALQHVLSCIVSAYDLGRGRGVQANPTEARKKLEDFCQRDQWIACHRLAKLMLNDHVTADFARQPIQLLLPACQADDIAACHTLGVVYAEREDNIGAAYHFFQRACSLGDTDDCENAEHLSHVIVTYISVADMVCRFGAGAMCPEAASFYASDFLTAADVDWAFALFARGCQLDNVRSCIRYVQLAQAGVGSDRDAVQKVTSVLTRLCHAGDLHGCHSLAELYLAINDDRHAAMTLLERACSEGLATSCDSLGYLIMTDPTTGGDPQRAIPLFTKACEGGNAAGCFNLGATYYSTGDLGRAVRAFTEGCHGGDGDACLALSKLYDAGEGVAKNPTRARQLRATACYEGKAEACPDAP